MRIQLEGINFDLPAGFQTPSLCLFWNLDRTELLLVARFPAAGQSMGATIANQRKEFEYQTESRISNTDQRPLQLLGKSAEQLSFDATVSEQEVHVSWIVAAMSDANYLQITHYGPRDPDATQTFERMLASVSLPGAAGVPAAQPDWVRRFAGPIELDVPHRLSPPEIYEFASLDERLRLAIGTYTPGLASGPAPSFEAETTPDTERGAVLSDLHTEPVPVAGTAGAWIRYTLAQTDQSQTRIDTVYRARVPFSDGLIVTLAGRGPRAETAQLEGHFFNVLRSIYR